MRYFLTSIVITLAALALSYAWAGQSGLFTCVLLIILEVTFSIDNAVVNATVLKEMSALWQRRFLTWGMLITVFGMYYFSPILIVSLATGLGIGEVMRLALHDAATYSQHLAASHTQIAAFGGMFLLMVFLTFVLDETKELHWLGGLEKNLAKLGKLEAVETIIALIVLLLVQHFIPDEERLHAFVAGVIGVVLYVSINSVIALFGLEKIDGGAKAGLLSFIYLNVLDASFSLDAVVGSFAISNDILIIVLGLTAGAMFVRSTTVYMVREGTLEQYVFLAHGAHYAIGALAVIMLISIVMPVSQLVTGLVGIVFIAASLLSSIKYNRKCLSNGAK